MRDVETDWAALADELQKNQRQHAGFFSWATDRTVEEQGAARSLQESMEAVGEGFFTDVFPRKRGEDPPDCEAKLLDGGTVGIELTELVHGESIAAQKRGESTEWRPWPKGEIEEIVRNRILTKDNPATVYGGPYDQYVLVIYTDEPRALDHGVLEHLKTCRFGPCTLIDRCFLLLSYMPWEKRCPYIELGWVEA